MFLEDLADGRIAPTVLRPMEAVLPSRVRLGAFELDVRAGELLGPEGKVMLQQQPFQVLLMLVERRGGIATRDAIRKQLWPNDTVVEFDHSINTAIKKLRQALGDSSEDPKYIETVARRGYRLLVSVEWVGTASDSDSPGVRSPEGQRREELSPERPALDVRLEEDPRTLQYRSVTSSPGLGILSGRKVSHYRVLELLGGGGMGVVYRAEDLKLGRRVALKFLPEELAGDPVALERFEREARAASALEHQNICPVYEFAEHEGQPFIAMQLLSGQTLREHLVGPGLAPARPTQEPALSAAKGSAMPIHELLTLALQIADGLDAAHSKDIIHRDIKPANIFITIRGDVKILDFGLAKLTVDSGTGILPVGVMDDRPEAHGQDARATAGGTPALPLTRTGVAMGTAPYMSPEQVRGEKLDARTDVFSFGLVLYEMATGQAAFAGETVAEVHNAIINRAPSPARELNPHIPRRLEQIISKALEKDREARYQTASEMRSDLERLKRDTESEHGAVVRRRRSLVLGVAALVVAAGASTAWLLTEHRHVQGKLVERQITANPTEDYVTGAAISPDGKYLAYHDQTGLYVRSTESGETHAVPLPTALRKYLTGLEWFPDGGKLLAVLYNPVPYSLWVITTLGEAQPQLLYENAILPAISPDGQSVAFDRCCVGSDFFHEIMIGGARGETSRKLVTVQGQDEAVRYPVWSPDGRWIAYARFWKTAQGSDASAIEIRPAAGGNASTVVLGSRLPKSTSPCPGGPSMFGCMVWSPDWRLIFAVGQIPESPVAQTNYSLWAVPVRPRTGEGADKPRQLTPWSDFDPTDLTITRDGRRLSIKRWRSWTDVYLAELGAGNASVKAPRRITLDNRGISSLDSWTPDSRAILFSSSRNERAEVFKQEVDENIAGAIVRGPEAYRSARLTADGSWLLYAGWTPTAHGTPPSPDAIMRRPARGGPSELVLQEPGGGAQGVYTWDYKCPLKSVASCVIGEKNKDVIAFYSFDPVRGKGKQLGKAILRPFFGWDWDVSPDGSRLALIGQLNHEGQIEALTISDGAWREISPQPPFGLPMYISWAADGKGFFVTSYNNDSQRLQHVRLDGRVEPLIGGDGENAEVMQKPLPSPDGKYLAYEALTYDSNVWILENF